MLDILRDPIWQFILGVSAILIPTIVSFRVYKLQETKKDIVCKVMSITPLVDIKDDMQGKLRVFFDDAPVDNAYVIALRITNSGKLPVTSAEQETPIQIHIGTNRILEAKVLETSPKGLTAVVSNTNDSIVLNPLLLNAGDSLTIKVVTDSYSGKISTSGRIVGVNQVKLLMPENKENQLRWQSMTIIISLVIGIIGISTVISAIFAAIRADNESISVSVVRGDSSPIQETTGKENIPINNCNGSSDVEQQIERGFTVSIELTENPELIDEYGNIYVAGAGTAGIGSKIAAAYGFSYNQQVANSSSLRLSVPPNSNSIYTVEYYDIWENGIAIVSKNGEELARYPYKIKTSSSIQLFSMQGFDCSKP